jgi:hypothetical protein
MLCQKLEQRQMRQAAIVIIFSQGVLDIFWDGNVTNTLGHREHGAPARGFREAIIMHSMYFSDCFKIAAALRCRLHPPTVLSFIPLA